jgi:hypothetical protein
LVQVTGLNSNTSLPHDLISELENWEAVLKSDPEIIKKLREFEAAASAVPEERPIARKSKPTRQMQGPSL